MVLLFMPMNPADLTVPVVHSQELDYSTTTLKTYAAQVAKDRNLNVQKFVATIECESGFQHDAVGDKGTSLGIAQFRFPERDWGVASSTVLNPYKAINLMADAWEKDLAYKWTCWQLLSERS